VFAILLAGAPTVVFADGPATITVGSSGEVSPGTEFTVPVNIAENPGFAAAAFSLTYDKNALELVSFSADGLLKGGQIENLAEASVGYFAVDDLKDNGLLFAATFRVKDTAATGTYDLQIGLRGGLEDNLVNSVAEPVAANFATGSVRVIGGAAPPADGEGGNTGGTGDTGGTEPGNEQTPGGEQGNPSTTTPQTPAGTTPVTAVGADGSEVEFLMRSTEGEREYSLDDGQTWKTVPESGVITTPDGKTISVDDTEDADYVVKDLPEGLTATTSPTQNKALIWIWPAAVGVIAVIVAVVYTVMKKRRTVEDEIAGKAGKISEGGAGSHSRETKAKQEGL
jgi:hypothetical protein